MPLKTSELVAGKTYKNVISAAHSGKFFFIGRDASGKSIANYINEAGTISNHTSVLSDETLWEEIVPLKTGKIWLNIYPNVVSSYLFPTKEEADIAAVDKIRLACIEVDWVEGQGLTPKEEPAENVEEGIAWFNLYRKRSDYTMFIGATPFASEDAASDKIVPSGAKRVGVIPVKWKRTGNGLRSYDKTPYEKVIF